MKCIYCGEETPEGEFCINCGSKMAEIVRQIKTMPDDVRNLVVALQSALESPKEETLSVRTERKIYALGDVTGVEPGSVDKIYATGNVSFAPREMSELSISSSGKILKEPVFRTAAVLRRESGGSNRIAVYTDAGRYTISGIGDTVMRRISREPVAVLRNGDRYFVFSKKSDAEYVRHDGCGIDPGCLVEMMPNDTVSIGGILDVTITKF